jgi:hypothetical protein
MQCEKHQFIHIVSDTEDGIAEAERIVHWCPQCGALKVTKAYDGHIRSETVSAPECLSDRG